MPDFLRPVAVTPLKKGDDLRTALPRRTAELDTANSRIKRGAVYIAENCKAAP